MIKWGIDQFDFLQEKKPSSSFFVSLDDVESNDVKAAVEEGKLKNLEKKMNGEFVMVDKYIRYLAIWNVLVVVILLGIVGYICGWK